METLEQMRAAKNRPKDPVYEVSGRLSHAVRIKAAPDVIEGLRQELAVAQVAKYLSRVLSECPPTRAQARSLCKMITDAAAA